MSKKKTEYMQIKVSVNEKEKIRKNAEAMNLTISSYVRMVALKEGS